MSGARQSTNSSVWVIISVAVTATFGIFGFVWSIVEGQVSEIRADMNKFKEDSRWNYASKDFVTGKIDGIKDEEATYRRLTEKALYR